LEQEKQEALEQEKKKWAQERERMETEWKRKVQENHEHAQ